MIWKLLQQCFCFCFVFVKINYQRGQNWRMSIVSIFLRRPTIADGNPLILNILHYFRTKSILRWRLELRFHFFGIFFVFIFKSPLELRCFFTEHNFIFITVAGVVANVSKKIMAKVDKFDWNISNAEFEILFNYSIYLQKPIVFKKFT